MALRTKKPLQTSILLSLGIGLAICAALASIPAGAAAKKPATPPSLYWGAQIGPQITGESAPWDMNAVQQFQKVTGKGLSLIEFAQPFAECSPTCVFTRFPATPLENARSYGAIPVLSLNSTSSPPSVDQPAFRLARIIDGSFDGYLQYFAAEAKKFAHPFFLRFNWEMNGFWFPWSEGVNGNKPGEYVAAWRHVHDIFAAAGATNVSWVWCPNVNIYGELAKLGPLYPGNRYVDWTCLDGFNWGIRSGSPGWLSFNKIYHSTYKQILRLAQNKPMMIAEVASTEKGGSKAAWIKEMLSKLRNRYRKVRAVIWHDTEDRGTGWPIETSSRKARNAFKKGIANRAYRPNIFGGIEQSPIRPPAPG